MERAARKLQHRLAGSVQRSLRMAEQVLLLVRGGLNGAVLAGLLREQSDVNVHLLTVQSPGDEPPLAVRRLGRRLHLSLVERRLSAAEAQTHARVVKTIAGTGGPGVVDELIPFRVALAESRTLGTRLLVGDGADDLFGGRPHHAEAAPEDLQARLDADLASWQRLVQPLQERLANEARIELRYPYLDPVVVRYAQGLPPDLKVGASGEQKRVLRALAESIGVPV